MVLGMSMPMRLSIAASMLAASLVAAHAQSTGSAGNEAAPGLKGIGLTPVQRKFIYEHTAGERRQVPPEQASLGAPVPDSVMLNEMPVHVKDEVGLLRDFKFAVVQDAQSVVIVDPTSRKIVDIVTKDDAAK